MKKHNTLRKKRILRKKRTLKQRKNAQFRHYTRQTTLSSKMKGGAGSTILKSRYIDYRETQLSDASRVLEEINYTASRTLKSKLEELKNLLSSHILKTKNDPNTEIWIAQEQKLFTMINTINTMLIANYPYANQRRISQPFIENTSVENTSVPQESRELPQELPQESRELPQESRSREPPQESRSREPPQESRSREPPQESRSRSRSRSREKAEAVLLVYSSR